MNMEKNDPYRIALIKLISSISREVQLDKSDQVLLLLQLDTEEKVSLFNRWVKTKLVNGTLKSTPEEIMNASAKIGKGIRIV